MLKRGSNTWENIELGPGVNIDGVHYPGQQIWLESLRVASALQAKKIAAESRILISGQTDYRTITSFLGAIFAGFAPCLVAPMGLSARATERHLVAAASACDPAVVIAWDSSFDKLDLEKMQYDTMLEYEPAEPEEIRSDAIHHVQLTSGSTSKPKAVLLTHANVENNINALVQASGANSQTKIVSWLPLYHDMGLVQVLVGLRFGFPLYLMSTFTYLKRPLEWIKLLSDTGATHTAAPPFAFHACAKAGRLLGVPASIDLSKVSQMYVGAEQIPISYLVEFLEVFSKFDFDPSSITPSYGLAESVLAVAVTSPRGTGEFGKRIRLRAIPKSITNQDQSDQLVVACGSPVEGMEFRIVDSNGLPMADDVLGRIQIRGTSLSPRYLSDEKAAASSVWRDTGDLGFLYQGELYVTGREKEIIIVHGRNFAPHDIEEIVESHQSVGAGRSIATNVTAPDGEQKLALLIESRLPLELHKNIIEEIQAMVRSSLGLSIQHIQVVGRGVLPKTTSGKRQRLLARKLLEQTLKGERTFPI